MTIDEYELRRIYTSASLGMTAYRTWAVQARHERRFNIARLLDALSVAKMAKAEYAFQRLGEVGTTSSNVERALNGLEPESIATGPVTGTNPLARDMLQRARRALSEDRDLRADELGDIFVCTTCGFLGEGQCLGACEVCGTVPEAHRSFRAIESMGTCGPHAIVHSLEHTEAALRKLVDGVDEDLLTRWPDPTPLLKGEHPPSLKELMGHLVDIDAVFRERAWLLLETDRPELPVAHPPRLDSARAYRSQPIAEILEAFHESRRQTLSLLRGLTYSAWHRRGHHELYGDIDLLHQGNWMINHEHAHLVEMAQIRHDLLLAAGKVQQAVAPDEPVTIELHEGE